MWSLKKAECRRINAFELWCLEKTLDCKELQPVHPKDQSWMFIGLSQVWNWMWQVALRISWLTQGLPTLSWPHTLESSPSKPVPFWVLQEKQLQKDSPKHSLVVRMDKYFLTSLWWSLSVMLPYWEQIFPWFWNLAPFSVLVEDALKLSLGGKLTIFTSHQVKQ